MFKNTTSDLKPLPEIIQTKRLLLRQYKLEDVDDILAYANNPDWSRFLPVPCPYERQHAIDFINAKLALDPLKNSSFAIVFENKVAGGLDVRFDFNDCRAELGYSINPSIWGRGLVTEAAQKVIDLSFYIYPEISRFTATAAAENVSSLRVMEKLGMIKEGYLRQHQKVRGKFLDIVCCGILREEWEAGREKRIA
ncbi:MAG TPA: GNAT family protein [Oligoflexia bacterium]|nr:GNAT family protein [Oligoflexia bacterium]